MTLKVSDAVADDMPMDLKPHILIEDIDDPVVLACVMDLMAGDWSCRWPAAELRLPWYARGQCASAARKLAAHAAQAGLDAWMPRGHSGSGELDEDGDLREEFNLNAETYGYGRRLNRGYPTHFWACIGHAGRIWGIDLTAAQYGYPGPLARSCESAGPEAWAHRFIEPHQLADPIAYEDVIANRRAAGLGPYAVNPTQVQVWMHPDGKWRYTRSYAMDCADFVRTDLPEDPDLLLDEDRDAA